MSERTYTYDGPLSAVTLPADDTHPKGRHVQFVRGLRVTLPDDNAYVQSLVAQKYLVPVAETATETKVAASTASAASEPKTTTPSSPATAGLSTTAMSGTETKAGATGTSTAAGPSSAVTGA